MNNANPYLPPDANLADTRDAEGIELASRWQRLGAALLDTIFNLIFIGPMMFAFGIFDYSLRGEEPPFSLTLGLGAIGFVVFVLLHGYFLKRDGQTIGKKIIGIRIADLDDGQPQFSRIIVLRYLPISAVALIPFVGQLLSVIDALFIFRSDRRCIHDRIAGTKVVLVKKR